MFKHLNSIDQSIKICSFFFLRTRSECSKFVRFNPPPPPKKKTAN